MRLLGLFLALGSYNPLLSWIMHTIPALRLMQYPVKFLLLSAFALAVMSGFGVDEFFTRMQAQNNHTRNSQTASYAGLFSACALAFGGCSP